MSLSGALTPRLDIVAGAVLLQSRVTGEGVTLGRVGPRPVGIPARSIQLNLGWRPPLLDGLSFDLSGFELWGAGAYDIIAGRVASTYPTVDF